MGLRLHAGTYNASLSQREGRVTSVAGWKRSGRARDRARGRFGRPGAAWQASAERHDHPACVLERPLAELKGEQAVALERARQCQPAGFLRRKTEAGVI